MYRCFLKELLMDDKEEMLDEIFIAKEDDLSKITEADKKYLSEKGIDTWKAYNRVLDGIDNIPNGFVGIITELKESVDDLVEQNAFKTGYLCEKYYKNRTKKWNSINCRRIKRKWIRQLYRILKGV